MSAYLQVRGRVSGEFMKVISMLFGTAEDLLAKADCKWKFWQTQVAQRMNLTTGIAIIGSCTSLKFVYDVEVVICRLHFAKKLLAMVFYD